MTLLSTRIFNTRNKASSHQFIDDLFNKHAKLLPIRIDLGYKTNCSICDHFRSKLDNEYIQFLMLAKYPHAYLSTDMITNHWTNFLNKLRWNKLEFLKEMVGYIWKIEFGYSKGIHYHLALFFNGNKVKSDYYYATLLGELWIHITQNCGIYYNCSTNKERRYASHNALKVTHRNDDRTNLYNMVNYLTKSTQFDEMARMLSTGRLFGKSVVKT